MGDTTARSPPIALYVGCLRPALVASDTGGTGVERFLAIKSSEKRVVVAFRGTDFTSVKDALADIAAVMPSWTYGGGGSVHLGFLGQYTEQRSDLIARLQKQYNDGNRNWIFTGHSLGGALAQLAARDLQRLFPSATADLIVFGASRSEGLGVI